MVKINTKIMTLSDCYKSGRKSEKKGIMVHLTATPGVMAAQWFSRWNRPGVSACVHYFLDDKEIWQYLPDDYRGWHGGHNTSNNNLIGIEGCEPAGHSYNGSTAKNYNVSKNEKYFNDMYNNYIDLSVYLCKKYGWTEKDIIGHIEGGRKGIATKSGDPDNLFLLHKKSMNIFREDVKRNLVNKPILKDDLYRVQTGAFSKKENADKLIKDLKSKGFETYIIQSNNLYKVQIGAFSKKENADKLALDLNKKGFQTFISTNKVLAPILPKPIIKVIKVGSKVKIKNTTTKYSTGQIIPERIKKNSYTIQQINNDKALLKEIVSWVYIKDLI